ncbi:hypothetical protein [Alkanindiges illinoisensis]|uniref:Uncharacterized protein n=1 Tax=Alkanindiges illinoisensis TaxID=197183 RepID=A0A4Y7XDV8_9GAMM|nr:hypothetical protein [Alkanindiges illinoisensis]TEU29388.1 hypothetical protein E2B99_04860 [Alkanindiges illinoisensis]
MLWEEFKMYEDYKNILNGYRGEFDMYWSDFGIISAISILKDFNSRDWQLLINNIQFQSENWQVACVETLSEIEYSEFIFHIIEILLNTDKRRIKIALLDTVNSWLTQKSTLPEEFLGMLKVRINTMHDFDKLEQILIANLNVKL